MSDNDDTWTPKPPPKTNNVDDVLKWAHEEFHSQKRFVPKVFQLAVSYRAPARPRAGMFVYADGTEWDPGSGEGLYVYSIAAAWVAL